MNLNLLYNIYDYLYPLFYYSWDINCDLEIYSPVTKKSICKSKYKNKYYILRYNYRNINTDCMYFSPFKISKCSQFKISKEDIKFLKTK